ncbi:MAG TPA: diadenylate cyclase [Candidatus Binatia bacterium]
MIGTFATISDIIDILFVAILVYTAMVWLRTTRAAFVLRGIFVLAIVYLIARQFELQLTAWIFQGFFAIFLIMIVVIFQEELRQIFERVAVWSWRSSANPVQSETANTLVRTAADLGKDRIGALVVVAGSDPLARHVVGGIPLDGKVSEPLLRSIFDPHSPGHDGAVIIEHDRVTRFAAHLPLSKDLRQLVGLGTRHSAALGIAELTDALAIVVSEQRGTISAARDGRLHRLENPQELVALLERFLQKEEPNERRIWKWVPVKHLRENWQAKAIALAMAFGFWYVFVPGAKVMEATYRIPVQVQNIPADYELESFQPTEVEATFSGPRRAFYFFHPRRLKVTVDASTAESGRRTFMITPQSIRHPNEITVEEVKPQTLRLTLRRVSAEDKAAPDNGLTGG